MNKTLTHLDLSYNKLSDSGAHCIFQSLQQNTTLTHLNLQGNGIAAGHEDSAIFQVNTSLTHLNLSHNVRFSSSTCFIFESLQHNTTLTHLDLSVTGMGHSHDIEPTFQVLNKMLIMNQTLAYLNLSYNGISESGACSIFQALQHNTALVHLDLQDNDMCISDEVAVCIAEVLESNRSLQILNICSNEIESMGFDCIAKSLELNTTLRKLYLSVYGRATVNAMVETIHRLRQVKGLHPVYIGECGPSRSAPEVLMIEPLLR